MEKGAKGGVELQLKARVESEVADWINGHSGYGERSNVTSKALEFYHWYLFYRKGFFIYLIEDHFEEIRKLLRKIGRIKKKNS